MNDVYLKCDDCGEQTLLDSGPLGLNCFSEPCLEKSKILSRRLVAAWTRREAARLTALADEYER